MESSAATAPASRRCSRSSLASPSRRKARQHQRPGGEPARSRHWLSPRAHRAREHLSQRRHPRHDARRDWTKFDEIVAFAEVEKFLDTPVKRYSSGMYVRLAFAVAAHLEPRFWWSTRCSRLAMRSSRRNVSARCPRWRTGAHDTVREPQYECDRAVMSARTLVRARRLIRYLPRRSPGNSCLPKGGPQGQSIRRWRPANGFAKNNYFLPQELLASSGDPLASAGAPFSNKFDIIVDVRGQVLIADPGLNVGIGLYTEEGELLFKSFTTDEEQKYWVEIAPGPLHLQLIIPRRLLNEGNYRVELLASLHYRAWLLEPGRSEPTVSFSIQGGLSNSPYWDHKRPGILAPVLRWHERSQVSAGC